MEVRDLDQKQLVKLLVFNVLFAAAEIILYSKGIVNLGARLLPAVIVGGVSIALFLGINFLILNSTGKKKHVRLDKVKTVQDYRDALTAWQGKSNPFNPELREAVHQLDLFTQKETALKALLGDQAKEPTNPFMIVSNDVRDCLLSNMRKLLNRMTILDPNDQNLYPTHNGFIHHVLGQNKQLLSQYDNLIIEISQIGDTSNADDLHLENITAALREMRDDHATTGEYSAAIAEQQFGDE